MTPCFVLSLFFPEKNGEVDPSYIYTIRGLRSLSLVFTVISLQDLKAMNESISIQDINKVLIKYSWPCRLDILGIRGHVDV